MYHFSPNKTNNSGCGASELREILTSGSSSGATRCGGRAVPNFVTAIEIAGSPTKLAKVRMETFKPSENEIAAVDHERVARVIFRGVAREIDRDPAKIGWLAPAPHRHARQHLRLECRVFLDTLCHIRGDPARRDGVGANAVARMLHRDGAHHRQHRAFGGAV